MIVGERGLGSTNDQDQLLYADVKVAWRDLLRCPQTPPGWANAIVPLKKKVHYLKRVNLDFISALTVTLLICLLTIISRLTNKLSKSLNGHGYRSFHG